MVIAGTGFLLANKGRISTLRPPETSVPRASNAEEIVSLAQATEAVLALDLPEFQSLSSLDRIDYRPKSNIYKFVSREGYREVQVSGQTGEVLSIAPRNDQLIEDIHDLSIFGDLAHGWVLPAVAICLFGLGLSGVCLFFVPVFRRRKFKKDQAKPGQKRSFGGKSETS
jgi:hypothetical protein